MVARRPTLQGLDGTLLGVDFEGRVSWSLVHGQPTAVSGGVPISGAACGVHGSVLVRIDQTAAPDAIVGAKQAADLVAFG